MSERPVTPLEIYKILEQSNCGRCQLPSCLAFAAAVAAGSRKLHDCPLLDRERAAALAPLLRTRSDLEPDQAEFIDRLEAD
jgi:CO dehydrogenase/acetyl-CoA synthase gamma subunit (corrinoid Fe-S protein)